jgi:hypothetical protein
MNRLTQGRLRQIIKEEVNFALREVEDEDPPLGDLVIKRADLNVEYNDAETSSQEANIEVNFTWMDSPGEAVVLITSFTVNSRYVVERIAEEINYSINYMEDTENKDFVSAQDVKMAMGRKLAQLMNEIEQLQEEYEQQARYL